VKFYGVDFTCAPRRAKPIVVAVCIFEKGRLQLKGVERHESFPSFEAFLHRPGPWIGGFDFPFGLPLELVKDLDWPQQWKPLVRFCEGLSRQELRDVLDRYRATRAVGSKYAHRATDGPAGSSSPMKLVNPPVALMFHEGAPRLLDAGVHIPGLAEGDRSRIALEAYPGLFARSVVGRRSYKSDTRAEHTPARRDARVEMLRKLKIRTTKQLQQQLIGDGSGDSLDAVICASQAAAAWRLRSRNFGLPKNVAPCEGWIIGAR
jgi:hypothetical protein